MRACQRSKSQPERIIEWAYNKHNTLGLLVYDSPHRSEIQGKTRLFRLGPLLHVIVGEFGLGNERANVASSGVREWEHEFGTWNLLYNWLSLEGRPRSENKASSNRLSLSLTR